MAQPRPKPRRERRPPRAKPIRVAVGGELWDAFVIWKLGPGLSLATVSPRGVA